MCYIQKMQLHVFLLRFCIKHGRISPDSTEPFMKKYCTPQSFKMASGLNPNVFLDYECRNGKLCASLTFVKWKVQRTDARSAITRG